MDIGGAAHLQQSGTRYWRLGCAKILPRCNITHGLSYADAAVDAPVFIRLVNAKQDSLQFGELQQSIPPSAALAPKAETQRQSKSLRLANASEDYG